MLGSIIIRFRDQQAQGVDTVVCEPEFAPRAAQAFMLCALGLQVEMRSWLQRSPHPCQLCAFSLAFFLVFMYLLAIYIGFSVNLCPYPLLLCGFSITNS